MQNEPIGNRAKVYVESAGGDTEVFFLRASNSSIFRADGEHDVTFSACVVQNGPDTGARTLSIPRSRLLRVVTEA